MVDTILSPNGVEGFGHKVIIVPGLGVVAPVGSLTPAEVQELRDDVAAVANQNLGDLADVNDTSRYDGSVLTWDDAADLWKPGFNDRGVYAIEGPGFATVQPAVIQFLDSLVLSNHPSNPLITRVGVQTGSSGSSTALARADHVHPPTLTSRLIFNKSGAVLGAGINDLVNQSVSGLLPHIVYDVSVNASVEVVNTNESGRVSYHIQIGSTGTIQTVSRGASGGVWTPVPASGARQAVTGVTNLPLRFWAEYESGDPTALYSGYLAYTIAPRGGTT